MKRVLSIQDLSCLGKCSLTVALPVLSAMGCACSVLPTAVLSTHTAFPDPYVRPMTQDMIPMAEHWASVGAGFDAITVGYLADPNQAEVVEDVLSRFDADVILDPVMGDHGKLYSRQTPDHVKAMEKLCRKARYVLPNVTEAALLTGLPYREQAEESYLRELSAGLMELGMEGVVITGFLWDDAHTGFYGVSRRGDEFSYCARRIDKHFHGTGDLFAAVFTGSLLAKKELYSAAKLAAGFVERVIAATEESTPFGIAFEPQLPWLWQQL